LSGDMLADSLFTRIEGDISHLFTSQKVAAFM
jgi:hypothetical protein